MSATVVAQARPDLPLPNKRPTATPGTQRLRVRARPMIVLLRSIAPHRKPIMGSRRCGCSPHTVRDSRKSGVPLELALNNLSILSCASSPWNYGTERSELRFPWDAADGSERLRRAVAALENGLPGGGGDRDYRPVHGGGGLRHEDLGAALDRGRHHAAHRQDAASPAEPGDGGLRGNHPGQAGVHGALQLRQGQNRPQHDQGSREPWADQAGRDDPRGADERQHRDRVRHGGGGARVRHRAHHARQHVPRAQGAAQGFRREAGADAGYQGHGRRGSQGGVHRGGPRRERFHAAAVQQPRQPEDPPRDNGPRAVDPDRRQDRRPRGRSRHRRDPHRLRTVPQGHEALHQALRGGAGGVGRAIRWQARAPQDPGHRGRFHPGQLRHVSHRRGAASDVRRVHGNGPRARQEGRAVGRHLLRRSRARCAGSGEEARDEGEDHLRRHPFVRRAVPVNSTVLKHPRGGQGPEGGGLRDKATWDRDVST